MASYNKLILIGRMTRDPETTTFSNGGKVVKFGFAVNGRKKVNGAWVDDPMFIDVETFGSNDSSKTADRIEETCKKGTQLLLDGEIKLEQWTDKTQQKRSKHTMRLNTFQYMDAKAPADNSDVNREVGSKDNPNELYTKSREEIPF